MKYNVIPFSVSIPFIAFDIFSFLYNNRKNQEREVRSFLLKYDSYVFGFKWAIFEDMNQTEMK